MLFSHWVISDSSWPHGLQHSRSLCPPISLRVCSKSCPLCQWCYLTMSSSATLFSFAFNLFQHQGLFQWVGSASGGRSVRFSASSSVLPMNIQGWFPLGLTGLISLLSKELSRVLSSTTTWKHQFFGYVQRPLVDYRELDTTEVT